MLKAAFADQDFLAKLSSFVFRGCNISLPAADLNVTFFGNLTIVEHEKNGKFCQIPFVNPDISLDTQLTACGDDAHDDDHVIADGIFPNAGDGCMSPDLGNHSMTFWIMFVLTFAFKVRHTHSREEYFLFKKFRKP